MAGPFVASVVSVRQAMEAMTGMPDLPDGERRRIVVRSLYVAEASTVLHLLHMKSTTWRAINLTAIQALANAHELLTILAIAALPARVDSPNHASTLDWIRQC